MKTWIFLFLLNILLVLFWISEKEIYWSAFNSFNLGWCTQGLLEEVIKWKHGEKYSDTE